MYIVKWVDFCGNKHQKTYKRIETAIKKTFAVYGWFKNGECLRADGSKVL